MIFKKLLAAVAVICVATFICAAQTERVQVIENGGTGPYKAIAIGDASLPTHMIYRPANLQSYVEKNGKIPVLLYANGACANSSLQMSRLLTDVASYGYLVIAIGPYAELTDEVFYADWKRAVRNGYPESKPVIIMGNGERVVPMTDAERQAMAAQRAAAQNNPPAAAPAQPVNRTYSRQLLEALDWLTDQNASDGSEYYHMVDLEKVAAMGQSCGGAQVLGVTHDPRIKTGIILNSGMGEMDMQGASKKSLASLHTPMLYLNGGPADIAYNNANGDYANIGDDIPMVKISTLDGHHGTYYEPNGGKYAVAARMWLNWQLKGQVGDSALFMNDDYEKTFYPDWVFERKNW